MGLFTSINIAASGLSAERLRSDVIADNIANASTTRTQAGGPYQRSRVILRPVVAGTYWKLPYGDRLAFGQQYDSVRGSVAGGGSAGGSSASGGAASGAASGASSTAVTAGGALVGGRAASGPFAVLASWAQDGLAKDELPFIDEGAGRGVRVVEVQKDSSPPRLVYDPQHPDRILEGPNKDYVEYPNINIVTEMVDLIAAQRAYEANSAVINGSKAMFSKALEIGR